MAKNKIRKQIDALLKVLRELPSVYSLVALTKYYEGMSDDEIVAALGISELYYRTINRTLDNVAAKIANGSWRGLSEEIAVGELVAEGRIYPQVAYYTI